MPYIKRVVKEKAFVTSMHFADFVRGCTDADLRWALAKARMLGNDTLVLIAQAEHYRRGFTYP